MANPFLVNGGVPERQSRFAPLVVNRFWSGQYSNSSPLSEPTVPYLYSRFYSASRYETIRSGSNVEISPRLTLIRRPGLSVYNSATFPACTTFYSFRVFNSITQQVQIRVIADTVSAVYDATGPSTKQLLWTKVSGAGQTSFRSVGNTLYAADGTSVWKWVWFPGWQANQSYTTGTVIIDSNDNLQKLTSVNVAFANPSVTVTSGNVLLITWTGNVFTPSQLTQLPGSTVSFTGFVGASFLNGTSLTVTTATNLRGGSARLSFSLTHGAYGPTADSGTVTANSGSNTSGSSTPSWSATIGATTGDGGTLLWTNSGPAVQQWGINAPLNSPAVSNSFLPSGTGWVASTYYWPTPLIFDPNSNIQLLTTDGTTAASPPAFNTSGTTTDGSAVWTFQGQAARQTNHAYSLGAFIAVTVTTTYTTVNTVIEGRAPVKTYETITVQNFYFFTASASGTSSATTTANIQWPSAFGGTVVDGTVTWANCGYQVTRTNVGTSAAPSSSSKGTVGNTQAVTQVNSIEDDVSPGGGAGFTQNCVVAGPSAASHPTWATTGSPAVEATGLNTKETSGLTWQNAGPTSAANTGTWIYGYSFANSVTGHESSMSPATSPILLAANSGIAVSGNGDPNWATDGVDTINIYRSVQGFTTPFRLASIPAPAQGAPWTYLDASPDPPNPSSTLNEFIAGDTTGNNAPPPAGLTNLTYYLNRVFGSTGTFQYYSGVATQVVGVGAESWAGLNFMQLPEVISKSWPSPSGLLMFTYHGVQFSQGLDANGNPNTPIQILEDVGLLSPNLFTVNGSIPVLLTADSQMLALDPSTGVTRYSDPIADSANGMGGFSTASSYLTWHVNGLDTAFYLADGSTGWFRLCPTAAPESGFTWSTKANIVGGSGAVVSVETSPGVKQMLVGPTSSGPILFRDLTTNADNGTSYVASCIIGSLVLAQPNQCAEVRSISTYCVATGTRPQVSFLGNEVSPTGSVPFSLLSNQWQINGTATIITTPEPPFLATATSLYADRWYFSTSSQPAWLQHMQLQLLWVAENFPNELMSYALFGCVHVLSE